MNLRSQCCWQLARLIALTLGSSLLTVPTGARAEECSLSQRDCFLAADGTAQRASLAYRRLHAKTNVHPLRALLEEAVALGIGTSWYWTDRKRNSEDWDFPSLSTRFSSDVLRFDNNRFRVNFLGHPVSGAAYYALARTNELDTGTSLLYALGATFVWEYGIEFREKVSVNDLVATPIAGVALGEFWSRLSWYLHRPARGWNGRRRAAAWVFGPLESVHDALDGPAEAKPSPPVDDLGYRADVWHRFSLRAGVHGNDTRLGNNEAGSLHAEGAFVTLPSFLRRGRARQVFTNGDVTRFELHMSKGPLGSGEVDIYADTILAGIYRQDIDPRGTGGAFLAGGSVGYRYRRTRFVGMSDDLGIVHLPGLSLQGFGTNPLSNVRIGLHLHPDFAGVRAWAFEGWRQVHPTPVTKAVLERYEYAYTFGLSCLLELEINLPAVRVGTRIFLGQYWSRQGLDRNQEVVSADVSTKEWILDTQGYLRLFPVPAGGLFVDISVLMRERASLVGLERASGELRGGEIALGWEL